MAIRSCLLTLPLLVAACAGGGGAAPAPVLALLAGDMRGPGAVDGTGAAARFSSPEGVAIDSAGNLYVSDNGNSTIRKITPGGVVTTIAGTASVEGSSDGAGIAARFAFPTSVATDSAGNVYVADIGNSTIRKVTPAGIVTTLAGTAGVEGSADGTGPAASFNSPRGVAADRAGNIYVADAYNDTIRKVTPAGVVTTLAGTAGVRGSADGSGPAASFAYPTNIAIDSAGNIYVTDTGNSTVRKITPAGVVTTLASFENPVGIATDSAGNVYVSSASAIRKITPAGAVSTLAGKAGSHGSNDGTGAAARFRILGGIAVDSAGNVHVADIANSTIRKITPDGVVTTLAGTAPVMGSADGTGSAAGFNSPQGIAADSAGNLYVADSDNNTIRKITPTGSVTTLAGTAGLAGSTDGAGAAARFDSPNGVATDRAGNVYVAEWRNGTIRKITPAGEVTTLAGTAGARGNADGTGAAARFYLLRGVAVDSAGNVYAAAGDTVRKVTPDGVVTTFAGTAGARGSTDGTGAAARFDSPVSVATDGAGNVYVAEFSNSIIRKITPAGVVTTLAGKAGVRGSADGTGAAARFNWPQDLATDSAGNVYVADWGNSTIRKITPAGMVTTIVGVAGQASFVPGALPGRIAYPRSVAVSGSSLYITLQNGVAVVRNRP